MQELPHKPQTATFVKMTSPDKPNIFAFGASFPSGTKLVICSALQEKQVLDPILAKDYATRVVDDLIKKNDWDSVHFTNWASATAAIQAIIVQFNIGVRDAELKNFKAGMQ
jgi:hypothetical protein